MNVLILFVRSVEITSQAEKYSGSTQGSGLGDVSGTPLATLSHIC